MLLYLLLTQADKVLEVAAAIVWTIGHQCLQTS